MRHSPREGLLTFLGWEEPNEEGFAQDVRIILVSADFSKELTTAVLWLKRAGRNSKAAAAPLRSHSQTLLQLLAIIASLADAHADGSSGPSSHVEWRR